MRTPVRRWWTLRGDELANQVVGICEGLERDDTSRGVRYSRLLSMYEGRAVDINSDQFFTGAKDFSSPMYNLIRSACDTAQADIAGRQKPKPTFMTTGAEWKVRRRAKKLDKFTEAQLCLPQGQYADAWQLMLDVFHDATKLGMGIAKVWADHDKKQVAIGRVFPWEIHVDLREARYGNPQNLFHIYDVERDIAIQTYCGQVTDAEDDDEGNAKRGEENDRRRMAIESARSSRPDTLRVVESIKIREAWRLPLADGTPGYHAVCVDGCTLLEEEWTRDDFPFLFFRWNHDSIGFWGTGIAEEGEPQQLQINDTAERLSERIRICATRQTFYNPNTVKKEDLQVGGESETIIACSDMTQAPISPPVAPASEAEFAWLDKNMERFYELRGISQMSANAQKPSGVTAAVAMETLNDISTVRFLPKARAYETAFVPLAKLITHSARELAEHHGGYLVKWPGKRFLAELDWRDVSLEEDMYQIRIASVSQFSRDPSAVLEMAQELRSSGDITRETFLQMVGLPDLEEMLNRETAESEFISELLDRYLDSEDEDELDKNGGYEAPEPFLSNKPLALALCVSTYWEARRDRAPEFCLFLIRNFIQQLDRLIAPPPAEQPPAVDQAPINQLAAGGAPPPAAPPGPPGPPAPPQAVPMSNAA